MSEPLDPLTTYSVTLRQHEVDAIYDVVGYLRSLAMTFPDVGSDKFAARMRNYAQMLEDVADRTETESTSKQALNHIQAHLK